MDGLGPARSRRTQSTGQLLKAVHCRRPCNENHSSSPDCERRGGQWISHYVLLLWKRLLYHWRLMCFSRTEGGISECQTLTVPEWTAQRWILASRWCNVDTVFELLWKQEAHLQIMCTLKGKLKLNNAQGWFNTFIQQVSLHFSVNSCSTMSKQQRKGLWLLSSVIILWLNLPFLSYIQHALPISLSPPAHFSIFQNISNNPTQNWVCETVVSQRCVGGDTKDNNSDRTMTACRIRNVRMWNWEASWIKVTFLSFLEAVARWLRREVTLWHQKTLSNTVEGHDHTSLLCNICCWQLSTTPNFRVLTSKSSGGNCSMSRRTSLMICVFLWRSTFS